MSFDIFGFYVCCFETVKLSTRNQVNPVTTRYTHMEVYKICDEDYVAGKSRDIHVQRQLRVKS